MAWDQWPPQEILGAARGLEDLASIVRGTDPGLSDEARGWLARLLVVRASGYIEQVTVVACRGYVDAKSGGLVRTFARSWLEKSRNPTPGNLLQLVGRFDTGLEQELEAFLNADDERLFRELAFLVDRRNKISHGVSEGLGPARALKVQSAALEIGGWFILRMNPA